LKDLRVNRQVFFAFLTFLVFLILWFVYDDILFLGIWLTIIILIAISFGMAFFSVSGIEVKRYSRIRTQVVGGYFEERIEVKNTSRTGKLWFELIDESELMGNIHSRVITRLNAGKLHMFSSMALLNLRGFYELGPTVIRSGDPFGFFSTNKVFPTINRLTVYPRIFKINNFQLIPGKVLGGEYLQMHTPQTTPQAASVREYQPGDPLNRVHWPITVRKNKLMVKEFDEDTQSSAWIFLDAESGSYIRDPDITPAFDRGLMTLKERRDYEIPRDSFEYAVCAVASLVDFYTRNDIAVGFVCESRYSHILPADKGQRQYGKIMETLSVIKEKGTRPLERIVSRQIMNIHRGSAVILITPATSTRTNPIKALIRRRGLKPLVIRLRNDTFVTQERKGINYSTLEKEEIELHYGRKLQEILGTSTSH